MAEVDYTDIAEELQNILQASEYVKAASDSEVTIVVEDTFNMNADQTPWIGIYLDTWETPPDEERIGGANPRTTYLNIEVWMYVWHFEHILASKARDLMLRKVKEALKANRTINGKVQVTRFQGGEFENATKEEAEGFFKGVTLKLECEIRE